MITDYYYISPVLFLVKPLAAVAMIKVQNASGTRCCSSAACSAA